MLRAEGDDVQSDAETKSYEARLRILERALGKSFLEHMNWEGPTLESIALSDSFLLQLLDAAVRVSHLGVVRLLLERDLDLAPDAYGELKGRSVLHTGAFCNEGRIISLLVQHNADPMQRDNYGYYPLELAVRNGSESVVPVFMSQPRAKEILKKSKVVMHFIWSNTKLIHKPKDGTESGAVEQADELCPSTLFDRKLANSVRT
jgi:Ankyrin repeats (3 copies)